ncbi:MAG TPA: hypothetical protein VIL46_08090, partial [Gemmataceae bacterium]
MKRSAGAFVLLASLGGCMTSQPNLTSQPNSPAIGKFNQARSARAVPGVQGPWGQPIAMGTNGRAILPYGSSGVV